jgi:hypothetical protein
MKYLSTVLWRGSKYTARSFRLINTNCAHFSEELDELKSELKQEKQTWIGKLSSYISPKTNVKDGLGNLDILMTKNAELVKKDLLIINKILDLQSKNLSKVTINEECIPQLIDLFKSLNNIQNFISDKRYVFFIDDILFAINVCTKPKALIGILNFSVMFLKGKQFEEFAEKITKRILANLKNTDVEDMLFYLSFLKKIGSENAFDLISEKFKHEILRRLDKYYYKNSQNDHFIENDDFPKILYLYNQYSMVDKDLYTGIFSYINDNQTSFSIREIIEVCLFFIDKKNDQFIEFFNKAKPKLVKNIKNTSNDLLYDIVYIFTKMNCLDNEIVKEAIANLSQNTHVNKELGYYKIFDGENTKQICKFAYQISEFINSVTLTKENNDEREKLLRLVSDYFLINIGKFESNEIILLLDVLGRHGVLDEGILKDMMTGINSNLSKESVVALSNFYLNKGVEFDKKIYKNLEKVFNDATSDFKTKVDILTIYLRKGLNEKLTPENLDTVVKSYKGKDSLKSIKDNIITLWCLSYFDSDTKQQIITDLYEAISTRLSEDKVSNFEFMLLIHACSKLKDSTGLLTGLEGEVLSKLGDFELTDFVAIFATYANKAIGSEFFLEDFCDLVESHVSEFTLLHLEVIAEGLSKYTRLSNKQIELLETIHLLITKMKVKSLELSIEHVDENLIKESIREYFNEKVKYKKLI